MRCKFCGTDNPELSRTCSFCGSELLTEAALEKKRKMLFKDGRQTQSGPRNSPEEKSQTQPGPQNGPKEAQTGPKEAQTSPKEAQTRPDPQTGSEETQLRPGQWTIPDEPSHEQESDKKPSQENKPGRFTVKPKMPKMPSKGNDNEKRGDGGKEENNKRRMIILISAAAVLLAVIVLISNLIRKQKSEPAAASDTYSDESMYEETSGYEEYGEEYEGDYEDQYEQEAEQEGEWNFTGVLVGTVSDRETGNPISDARVIFYDDYNNEFPEDEILTTGSDGSFSIELPEGLYSVEVIKRGYPDYTTDRVYRVDRGETTVISRIEISAEKSAKQPEKSNNSDDDEYLLPFSNERYLTDADLDPLSEWELKLARNEIYARHGRRFKDPDLQSYFDSKSWYKGRYDPDDFDKNHSSDLREKKKKNAEYILKYEIDHNYYT